MSWCGVVYTLATGVRFMGRLSGVNSLLHNTSQLDTNTDHLVTRMVIQHLCLLTWAFMVSCNLHNDVAAVWWTKYEIIHHLSKDIAETKYIFFLLHCYVNLNVYSKTSIGSKRYPISHSRIPLLYSCRTFLLLGNL